MTLDYREDFDFFKAVYEALYKEGQVFSLKDIMLFLKNNPGVMNINKSVQAKYEKNIIKYNAIILKPGVRWAA